MQGKRDLGGHEMTPESTKTYILSQSSQLGRLTMVEDHGLAAEPHQKEETGLYSDKKVEGGEMLTVSSTGFRKNPDKPSGHIAENAGLSSTQPP